MLEADHHDIISRTTPVTSEASIVAECPGRCHRSRGISCRERDWLERVLVCRGGVDHRTGEMPPSMERRAGGLPGHGHAGNRALRAAEQPIITAVPGWVIKPVRRVTLLLRANPLLR